MPRAYIGLGSNQPFNGRPPLGLLEAAMEKLDQAGRILDRSSIYETAPVGYADQPPFLNAVVALETGVSPETLLQALVAIERSFGRERSAAPRNGPRTLDLDLLMVDQLIVESDGLTLPHPRLAERRFVLSPLMEIAPDLLHPVLGKTMRQLLDELPGTGENGRGAVKRLKL